MMEGLLPRKLRVLRAERGLTLLEVAEKAGIGRDTLSYIEQGRRHPSVPTLKKIADAYGVSVEDLIEEFEAPKAGTPPSSMQELLERAGVTDRHFLLTDDELTREIVEDLTLEEARNLAARISSARIAMMRLLEPYKEALAAQKLIARITTTSIVARMSYLFKVAGNTDLAELAEGNRDVSESVASAVVSNPAA